jgi:hypothetical protein
MTRADRGQQSAARDVLDVYDLMLPDLAAHFREVLVEHSLEAPKNRLSICVSDGATKPQTPPPSSSEGRQARKLRTYSLPVHLKIQSQFCANSDFAKSSMRPASPTPLPACDPRSAHSRTWTVCLGLEA